MSENQERPNKCARLEKDQISELEMMLQEKVKKLDYWLNNLAFSFHTQKTDIEALCRLVVLMTKVRDEYEIVKESCLAEMQRKGEERIIKQLISRIDGALMQIRVAQDQYMIIQME
ncbi:uncharacterized protein DMAD_01078 [Drosophila madeirensis]|uniref:Uncharacterized protein n=1 Tax=Drosophila madeirensis TaxID=30013 RepID=A0AAU9G021_DROMD